MNTVDKDFKKFTEKSVNKKPIIKKIEQKKLNTILNTYNIKKYKFFKIDVEGYEFEVQI